MNPDKCPCECHETFDHGSALVVDTYSRKIAELQELLRDADTELDDLRHAYKEHAKRIESLKDDVKRYRNG